MSSAQHSWFGQQKLAAPARPADITNGLMKMEAKTVSIAVTDREEIIHKKSKPNFDDFIVVDVVVR